MKTAMNLSVESGRTEVLCDSINSCIVSSVKFQAFIINSYLVYECGNF